MTPDPSVEPASGWHRAPKLMLFAALGLMTAPLGQRFPLSTHIPALVFAGSAIV